jgi:hypothetical protein
MADRNQWECKNSGICEHNFGEIYVKVATKECGAVLCEHGRVDAKGVQEQQLLTG